ncbi:unnamed protein product [Heterobilharzia americana]|nr:unnamed protein product [Heterobilharzia americana]
MNETIRMKKSYNNKLSIESSYQLTSNTQLPNELIKCLTILALCHTVETNGNDDEIQKFNDKIPQYLDKDNFYQATSPDEKALVIGAAKLGIRFMGSSVNENNSSSRIYRLEYDNDTSNSSDQPLIMEYTIDAVLEFDSVRKRMTVMAKHPDGTCHIHCKGAESSTFEICQLSTTQSRRLANKHVTQFAMDGLRTLVYASRQVDLSEYQELVNELQQANCLFGYERKNALKIIYSKIENNLILLCVTGVEDKLQPGAEKCLKNLREAGIQVWVLTGDKEETAITVSRSAGHFAPRMSLVRLTNCEDFHSLAYKLFNQLEDLKVRRRERDLKNRIKNYFKKSINLLKSKTNSDYCKKESSHEKYLFDNGLRQVFSEAVHNQYDQPRHRHSQRPGSSGEPIGLVIDGKSLRYALHPCLQTAFLDLCLHLSTVLCCRMTPLQKASVVQLVRSGLAETGKSPITAAIGDGGNDVAMLLQANIGIGIYGKEGKEAVRASDYAIPQFKYLQRLLLVHGHRSNYRICITMNLFYYKCVTFVTTQIFYTFYSGYSAVATFETVLFSIYNLTVTSGMCLVFGMFERHLPDKILNEYPYLYRLLTHQANLKSCIWWISGYHDINTGILMALQSTTTLDNINFRSYTKLSKSPAFWFAMPIILGTANLPSLLWRIISDAWWNLQIQLSNIPQKQARQRYRRSPAAWIRALTTSYLGYSSEKKLSFEKWIPDIHLSIYQVLVYNLNLWISVLPYRTK